MAALSVTNIAVLFAINVYALAVLGPGRDTDALVASATLPQIIMAVISGSLTQVLVPMMAGEDEQDQRRDAWAVLRLVALTFGALSLLLFATAHYWVPLMVPGFGVAATDLTVELARIQVAGMILAALNGVQWALYYARQQFFWAEIAPVLAGLVALGVLVPLLPVAGVEAVAWVGVGRLVLLTLLLAPGMGRPVRARGTEQVREVWRRVKPLLLGTAYYKTDPLVDRYLLSKAGGGGLSLYFLAQQIFGAGTQVLNKAFAVPLVPVLSGMYKQGDDLKFRTFYHRKLLQVAVISALGVTGVVVAGRPAAAALVGVGEIDAEDARTLYMILVLLSGMFFASSVGQVSASAFYARGDTRTPTRLGMLTYTVAVPAKFLGFQTWGVGGVAAVSSGYVLVNLLLQVTYLEKRLRL